MNDATVIKAIKLEALDRAREALTQQAGKPLRVLVFAGPQLAPELVKLGMLPASYEQGRRYPYGDDYEIAVHPLIPGTEFLAAPSNAPWMP